MSALSSRRPRSLALLTFGVVAVGALVACLSWRASSLLPDPVYGQFMVEVRGLGTGEVLPGMKFLERDPDVASPDRR